MNFTEQERLMSWGQRAYHAGYNARYEGKPVDADPAPFSPQGFLARRWRDGWHVADRELAASS